MRLPHSSRVLLAAFFFFQASTQLRAADWPISGATDPETMWQHEYGATHDQRMQWWREGRFGMFIHWCLYSVPAGGCRREPSEHIGEWVMQRCADVLLLLA